MGRQFTPKRLDVHQFRGEPYLIARHPPSAWSYEREIGSQDERYEPRQPHLIVPVSAPGRGALAKFEDDRMWDVAKAAMPGVPIQDAAWLNDYDA